MTPLTPPTADPAASLARFAATAPADVSYAFVDSPVGTMIAAQTERGLACLGYEDLHGGADPLLERIAAEISPRVLLAPAKLDRSRSRSRGRSWPRRRGSRSARRARTARSRPRQAPRALRARRAARWAPTRSRSSSPAIACSPATGRSTGTRAGCTASSTCSSSRACSRRACDASHARNAHTTVRSPVRPVPSIYDPERGSRPGLWPRREDAG